LDLFYRAVPLPSGRGEGNVAEGALYFKKIELVANYGNNKKIFFRLYSSAGTTTG
jgi:hypothetical protein